MPSSAAVADPVAHRREPGEIAPALEGSRMLVLLGILVVVVGFVARLNPLLVVVTAALVTGVLAAVEKGADPAGMAAALVATVEALGKAYNDNRYVSIVWLILPVIGLLEREGLQQRAAQLIARFKGLTTGRLLLLYLGFRQVTAAVGLKDIGGHPQMVRPLLAPMAEAAAEGRHGPLTDKVRFRIRAWAAATDNVGLFFGEDIFFAIASILLIVGFLEQSGYTVEPLHLAVWAIPTAICAFVIHGWRVVRLDRAIARDLAASEGAEAGR
jgi:uncharacterized membrane protein